MLFIRVPKCRKCFRSGGFYRGWITGFLFEEVVKHWIFLFIYAARLGPAAYLRTSFFVFSGNPKRAIVGI